ncbi:hypothetical protein KIF24_24635 [Micromonospora sp. Llam7]|uniref:hypothetical protein n=1 Tax=Micromonospora tarapacensis TaxID=2835305 RepID=UPI001C82A4B8|nr:hypothetical protein [Micromonospora tarapacensis]MBX7268901.1 hypothetical protein [Micromonospora tarapacensis]
MNGYLVWLTDGTLLAITADRCRLDRRTITFEKRTPSDGDTSPEDPWRTTSVLRWDDIHRVEKVLPGQAEKAGAPSGHASATPPEAVSGSG